MILLENVNKYIKQGKINMVTLIDYILIMVYR